MDSNDDTSNTIRSVLVRLGGIPRRLWRDLLSVYYTNTPVWRWLKSGTLVFFGFFLWVATSLLYSFQSEWGWLTYVMAYGFVLILWGPLTHMVVVPLAIRLRRTANHPVARAFSRHASKVNLSVFLLVVIVLGAVPIGPMMLDVTGFVGGDGSPDVSADVDCETDDQLVTCLVETDDRVDHVVVLSGNRELDRADGSPPFTLEFDRADAEEVVGQKQFTVELRDGDGDTLRRYVQTVLKA
ncbi:hypothetical protein [Natrarchaeobius chitinivorans]|uniref:Uncharacterized protein n=1 Tax=Natrarchaeobius chitinivorans TaxID=1679083 RepID=A0A3N6M130_NATCH|nr:hypothetical protein [Natrarchaeobius chitinivorans]RQG95347.1 hypothetical protein EA473_07720 [Natrarchaeobius chitinivorans]